MTEQSVIQPGATLGVLGGGQLGRMFTQAAHVMGFDVAVLDPDPDSPAGRIAEHHLCAPYTDEAALATLAQRCAAVTTEFENVPAASLRRLATELPVCPGAAAVEIAQNRNREKRFFDDCAVPAAACGEVASHADLARAAALTGYPAILKTAQLGYDGKGQASVDSAAAAQAAFDAFGAVECVLEQRIELRAEVSVVIARNARGESAAFPVIENQHRDGILATSLVPARVDAGIVAAALAATDTIAQRLDYRGVLAVEYFVTDDNRLLANEMAPRPHNSGHFSIDACLVSQYEQQVRALCNLPLGEPRQHSPAVMINLLGDLWRGQTAPDWRRALAVPGCRLHLYGKRAARAGRKMGHLTCTGTTLDEALRQAQRAYAALRD